ncbi:hypothetical protein AQUCO_01400041v1 [Aquilegia coerulea]|uniref:Uncharacterized protein n=1 Tax=Aquilegia coerulea TaxID=218851 RepID=A0A2G5DU90_AQUCA|nr:hypothetical protein AQUCO_01400041v1 [Aquilegia coerulea]
MLLKIIEFDSSKNIILHNQHDTLSRLLVWKEHTKAHSHTKEKSGRHYSSPCALPNIVVGQYSRMHEY